VSVIPCKKNADLRSLIDEYAEVLKVEAHLLGSHGLDEDEFYRSGLFRGVIERLRGQFSATMRAKREFVKHVLNFMEAGGFISDWKSSGESNRHDYSLTLNSGKIAAIELKGCLDGNNTNIYERPPHAQEFIMWSVCTNASADPRHNVWSGINTRLSAEIISRGQPVDGLVVWDMVCGTIGRPCPKLTDDDERLIEVGPYRLPPPCIYLFPGTIPSARNNPSPPPQLIKDVEILQAFHKCFGGRDVELSQVTFEVENQGSDLSRRTRVTRNNQTCRESEYIPIRRS